MARPEDRKPSEPTPRLKATRPATLVVATLAAAAVAWLGIDTYYGSMPPLPWLPPLTMLALAMAEAYAARTTKARIDRRAGAGPLQPLVIARYAVLGKASALVGAMFGGLYLGLTVWLAAQHSVLATAVDDLPPAVAGTVGSFALVAAALWLERACRIPPPPPGSNGSTPGKNGATGGNQHEDDHAEGGNRPTT